MDFCDDFDGAFDQNLELYFNNAPTTGDLYINGKPYVIGSSPQSILLTGQRLTGTNVDVTACFDAAVAELDNFDTSIENWGFGASGIGPGLISGGINGGVDNFMEINSTGTTGANSRLIVQNTDQWAFLSYGSHVSFDAKKCSTDSDLNVRISIDGSGGRFSSIKSYPLSDLDDWVHCTFELVQSNFQADGGTDFQATLANVTQLRILSADFPSWRGDVIQACIGIDNIVTGGCVLVAENLFQAPSSCPMTTGNYTCAIAEEITACGTYTATPPDQGNGAFFGDATHASWYKFTPTFNGQVHIYSCLGGVDTRLQIYEGDCNNLDPNVGADDNCQLSPTEFVNFASEISAYSVTYGDPFYIEWDDRWSTSGFEFTIECIEICPPNYAGNNNLVGSQSASFTLYDTDGAIESEQIIYGDVTYDSGTMITLLGGFEVKPSGVFHAYIDGCGGVN